MQGPLSNLGRREQQIMDILHRRGRATAADVLADLPDPPSYSAVRGMLRLLEQKGFVLHEWDGPRYVFRPAADPESVKRSAARHLLSTFFGNSMESAMVALLGAGDAPPSDDDLARLAAIIERARRSGGAR